MPEPESHTHAFVDFDQAALVVRCECGDWISDGALTAAVPAAVPEMKAGRDASRNTQLRSLLRETYMASNDAMWPRNLRVRVARELGEPNYCENKNIALHEMGARPRQCRPCYEHGLEHGLVNIQGN